MFDVTSSDVDEKEKTAWAEISLELNIGWELEQELKSELGFFNGVKKDAKFQNFDVEWTDSTIRIFFQIEQDASDDLG